MRPMHVVAIAVASFIAGLLVRPVLADSLVEDGNWWNALDDQEKFTATQGLIEGYQTGWIHSNDIDTAYVRTQKSQATAATLWPELDKLPPPKFSKTFDSYIDEVTDYYSSNPDLVGKVTVGKVLGCLRDGALSACLHIVTHNAKSN